MRKFAVVFGVAILLSVFALASNSLLGLFSEGEYSVYGLKKLFDAENVHYRDYKTFTEANADVSVGGLAALSLNGIEGESVTMAGSESDFDALIARLGVEVEESQNIGGIRIVYGYTKKLGRSIFADGKKINVEIAYRGGTVTVGTPVILGSY